VSNADSTDNTDSIDGYVAALDRALPRGCRVRRTMLAELRDGLRDAAAAYVDAGLTMDEAERRAVSESGSVAAIAEEFRIELAACQGKRAAMLLAFTLLAGIVAWDVVWSFVPSAPARPIVVQLAGVVDWAGLVGGGSALVTIVLLMLGARRRFAVRPVLGGMVAATGLSIAVVMGGSLVMNVTNPERTADVLATSLAVNIVGVLSLAMFAAQIWALWRTIRVMFSGPSSPADELVPA
jgi:hypothetical protein